MSYKFKVAMLFPDGGKDSFDVIVKKNDANEAKKEARKYFPEKGIKFLSVKQINSLVQKNPAPRKKVEKFSIVISTQLKGSKSWLDIAKFSDLENAKLFAETYSRAHPEHSVKAERK